ncbi:MAG TPA: hypothetical protein VHB01_09615 [Nitrosospira sp.]|nr:hypothetical protein [Nitrosospira sp.]
MGSDRSWRGGAVENRGREAFITDGREAGGFFGELNRPIFENSITYIHQREVREAGHEKIAERDAPAADSRKGKKDAEGAGEKPGVAGDNDDVDAVWHRGARPRNF